MFTLLVTCQARQQRLVCTQFLQGVVLEARPAASIAKLVKSCLQAIEANLSDDLAPLSSLVDMLAFVA